MHERTSDDPMPADAFDPFALRPSELRRLAEAPGWAAPSDPRAERIVAFLWLMDYLDESASDPAIVLWDASDPTDAQRRRAAFDALPEDGRLIQIRQFTVYASGVIRFGACVGSMLAGGRGFRGAAR